jgi:hypothetical protein
LGIHAKNKPGEDGERATEAIHRAKPSLMEIPVQTLYRKGFRLGS